VASVGEGGRQDGYLGERWEPFVDRLEYSV
jgi:hypothetical protein